MVIFWVDSLQFHGVQRLDSMEPVNLSYFHFIQKAASINMRGNNNNARARCADDCCGCAQQCVLLRVIEALTRRVVTHTQASDARATSSFTDLMIMMMTMMMLDGNMYISGKLVKY